MNTKHRRLRVRLTLLALCAAMAIAGSCDAHVACSPTPTCSLRDARFAPTPTVDAGPEPCLAGHRGCTAHEVSAGGQHSCAVTEAGTLICWGDNSEGQLGPNLDALMLTPDASNKLDAAAAISGDDAGGVPLYRFPRVLEGASHVTAGGSHTCALLTDGSVRCWGRNVEGQADVSSDRARVAAPIAIDLGGTVTRIDAGALHTCAIVDGRGVMCWGSHQYGQTGRDPSDPGVEPYLVPNTVSAIEVAAGVRHSCAILSDPPGVVCWGELIDETTGTAHVTATPVLVPGLEDARQISAGAGHSCVITHQDAKCWGANDNSQLGDGTARASATPVTVMGSLGSSAIATGGADVDGQLVGHTCMIVDGLQAACWGHNADGQLGSSPGPDRSIPHAVRGNTDDQATLTNVAKLDLGAAHSCATRLAGSVYCWGDNAFGQVEPRSPDRDASDFPRQGTPTRVNRFGSSY